MALRLVSLLASVLFLGSGCVPFRSKGTTHYLVLGIGVVSVSNTNKEVAQVSRANAIGLLASERGVKLGYGAESTVSIKTNENVIVEVRKAPFGPLNVNVPNPYASYVVEAKPVTFNPTNVCVTPYSR